MTDDADELVAALIIQPDGGPDRKYELRDGAVVHFERDEHGWREVGTEPAEWWLGVDSGAAEVDE